MAFFATTLNQIAPDGTVSPLDPQDLSGVSPTIASGGDVLTPGYIGEADIQIATVSLAGDASGA